MRIFTVVFIFIIYEKKKCVFNVRTGYNFLIKNCGIDFTQYT